MFFIKSERILDGCVWASPVDLFLFYPFDNQIAPDKGLMIHSDRGVQYASQDFKKYSNLMVQ